MATARTTILQIVPELDTGGAELSTIEIAEAIVKAGGRAIVLSQGGRLEDRLAATGAELINFPAATKNPLLMMWNARRIAQLIESERVDVVHARSRAPAWSALLAARHTRTPFVTTYHGAYGERGPFKRFYNSVMARADIVIANSEYTSALIQARYGTSPSKIRVIYRGVDGRRFNPDDVATDRIEALRDTWGVGPGQRIVLQAARLTSWKGQRVLIRAAAQLKKEDDLQDVMFILAGDAQGRESYADQLAQDLHDAGLSRHMRLVGHVDDIPAAFAAAHVAVVASSEPEAFGRAAMEAQVMKCPVIATRIGAPPETVRSAPEFGGHEFTGWLVAPGDSDELANKLAIGLKLSNEDRAVVGARARAHILKSFSLDAMKQTTLAVYDGLAGARLQAKFVEDEARFAG